MKNLVAGAAALASLFVAAPVQAQDGWADGGDAVYAGVYLNVKFGGAEVRPDDKLTYGFAAGLRHNQNIGALSPSMFTGRRQIEVRVFDTSFNQAGFRRLSLVGAPIVERQADGTYYVLGADEADGEDGKKGGSGWGTAGKVLMWTGIVFGGIMIYAMVDSCTNGVPEDDEFIDLCPT
ncbi:MAG: hypothetical protein EP335_02825 [Alphaproteobacteria bacterium]|nr:MAG: hypothetical protein EP335_02825 [Alphaproteobacteria bacterium]